MLFLARLDAFGRWREHSNSGKASMAVPLRLGQCKKALGTGIKIEGLPAADVQLSCSQGRSRRHRGSAARSKNGYLFQS